MWLVLNNSSINKFINFRFLKMRSSKARVGTTIPIASEQTIRELYNIQNKLDAGSFGNVYKAIHRDENRPCALKFMQAKKGSEEDMLREVEREWKVMSSLHHPNLPRYHYVFYVPQHAQFILDMTLVEGENLESYRQANKLTRPGLWRILHTLFDTIDFLHKNGIVHRDIKPANIMITPASQFNDKDKVTVVDLGFACMTNTNKLEKCEHRGAMGTAVYMAPELFSKNINSNAKWQDSLKATDVWAAGVLAYVMISNKVPFGSTIPDLKQNMKYQTAAQMPPNAGILAGVMERTFVFDWRNRATAYQISDYISQNERFDVDISLPLFDDRHEETGLFSWIRNLIA